MILYHIYTENYFSSYADDNDDNNIFDSGKCSDNIIPWFSDNQMEGNRDKCYLIVSTNESIEIRIVQSQIKK